MRRLVSLSLVLLNCLFIGSLTVFAETKLTVLFSGETHARLYPCDCPLSPEGGIARRATIIKRIREENPAMLLLDAGGAFAGGKYDEKTKGEAADRLRNDVYLKALELMGYDMLAIGDEELAFGLDYLKTKMNESSLPFVSANVFQPTGSRLTKPYLIKNVGGVKVGVIGVTTPELARGEFRKVAEELKTTEPIEEVKEMVTAIAEEVDVVIVLSHLGEQLSKELLNVVSGIDLLVNAHRKISARPFDQVNDTIFAQFSFQGKKLGRIDFLLDEKKTIKDVSVQQISLGREVKDDQEIADLLEQYEETVSKLPSKIVVDLYVMSGCSYGMEAEKALFPLMKEMGPKVDFHLYYLVEKEDDGFVSLKGEEELLEDRRQLAVARLYPDKRLDYILCYNESLTGSGSDDCLKQLAMDQEKVDDLAGSEETTRLLTEHYERRKRLRVAGSPTLYINNVIYQGRMDSLLLRKTLCEKLTTADRNQLPACEKVPECITDADCAKVGKVGICLEAGTSKARCEYRDAVSFKHSVIVAEDCFTCNQMEVISSTQVLFPGAQIHLLDKRTAEGKKLIEKYDISVLPAYIFDPEVEKTHKFAEVKNGFYRKGDKLLLAPEMVGASYLLKRALTPHKIDVFFAALSGRARLVVSEIIDYLKENPPKLIQIDYHIIGFLDKDGEAVSPLGQSEEEEARRALVIRKFYPDKFLDYLQKRNVHSSYWQDPLLELGLNPQDIRKLAEGIIGHRLYREEAELVNDLPLGDELAFLINNREVARINNLEAFRTILKALIATEDAKKKDFLDISLPNNN